MNLSSQELADVSSLVMELCGILLDESKGYLIESRLQSLVTEFQCNSYAQLVTQARVHRDRALLTRIIDAITTNETLFFRDSSPFEALQHKALPELIDAKAKTAHPKRLRIWSAASSTGQEVYSIAMVLNELIPNIATWDVNILGTDISDGALKQASSGIYSDFEIGRGLSPPMLNRYFTKSGSNYKVKDELRSLVSFGKQNLMEPFAATGPFDIIFCRNVVIYFTAAARADIFNRLARSLFTDGYLFVGSAESLSDLGPAFLPHHHCRSIFYRPNLPSRPAHELGGRNAASPLPAGLVGAFAQSP
ncbi:protein-glutamate O-methyltransferase CheR [Anatilimnocola sp. NA78]|uniref:CheR family methyltransferase n=1 Tax=Anatilimnocola sp. NA78 TaxID=3415683 RepID=UPI003CE46DAC